MEDVTCTVRGTKNVFIFLKPQELIGPPSLLLMCPRRSTVQRNETLRSDVETSGGVDGSEINRPAYLVVQLPALAAVFIAPFGVVCTAEIREVGEILEV